MIDAIDMLLREGSMANVKTHSEPQVVAVADSFEDILEPTLGVTEALRRTLENASGLFTSSTLVDVINKTGRFSVTEREVGNPLRRLEQAGEIRRLERGRGWKGNVYLKL
jgi:hypothetical protein